MNQFLLKCITWLSPLWRRMAVNPVHLRAIVETKLLIDDRRPALYYERKGKTPPADKSSGWRLVLTSLLTGLILMAVLISLYDSPVNGNAMFFMLYCMMLAMTLIMDFSTVLIDVRDNLIILPRPVSDRTMLTSRIVHILIHLSKLTFGLAFPAMIFVAIRYGIGGLLLFAGQVILALLMTIFLVNLFYMVLIRFTTPRKLRDIIASVQIVFTILLVGAYQMFPRLNEYTFFQEQDLTDHWMSWIAPPLWIATLWKSLYAGNWEAALVVKNLLAVVVTFAGIYIVIKYLAPGFNRKLSGFVADGSPSSESSSTGEKKQVSRLSSFRLSSWLCRGKVEKAAFDFVWRMTARSRDFKMRVYPSFGMILVYFVIFFFREEGNLKEKIWAMSEHPWYILILYFSGFSLINVLSNIIYSEQFKAGWIWYAAPVRKPGHILSGAFKAACTKFLIPLVGVMGGICFFIWGITVADDLLLAFVNMTLYGILVAFVSFRKLPFSQSMSASQRSGRFLQSMLSMLSLFLIGGLHYLCTMVDWLIYPFFLGSAGLLILFYYMYRQTEWRDIADPGF